MNDPVAYARQLLELLDDPSADEVDEGMLADALRGVLAAIPIIETRAIAGMIGMDPEQGAEKVRGMVRFQLQARRRALDDLARVEREHTSAYIAHDGKILRCSAEVAEAFRALKPASGDG